MGCHLAGLGVNTYTYDTENHLLSATTPSGTVTYTYDALGRRRTKTAAGVTTTYLSAGDREISEYTGSTLTRYVAYGPGLDEVLASVHPTTNQKTYAHMDGLGSVVATSLSGSTPAVNATYTYGQFGETTTLSGFPYRYTGRNLDFETGLYHYRARAYSPTIGRFLQIDPLGYKPGPNLYAYVGNDPLNKVDPMGTDPWIGPIVGAFSGAYFGGQSAYLSGGNIVDVGVSAAVGASLGFGIGLIDPSAGVFTLGVIGAVTGGLGDITGQSIAQLSTGRELDINWGSAFGSALGGGLAAMQIPAFAAATGYLGFSALGGNLIGAGASAPVSIFAPTFGGIMWNSYTESGQGTGSGAVQTPTTYPDNFFFDAMFNNSYGSWGKGV